jgi:outer membrane protein assembly factor BamD (BamD/ComL family)
MGRKRNRKGKHLYLYIAYLILLSLLGCAAAEKSRERIWINTSSTESKESVVIGTPAVSASLKEKKERIEIRDLVPRGQKLLSQGDYEGFIKENEKVLSLPGNKPLKDEALFNLGLVYAHSGSPKKDYGKSAGYFKRLLKDHPQSPFSEQAKMWLEVLQETEKLNETITKLNEMIEKSKQIDIEIEERKREKAK